MSQPTVRERVREIQRQLAQKKPAPEETREFLMALTGLLGYCQDAYRDAESAYKPVLLTHLRAGGAANRARIEAECSAEFVRMREAKDTTDLVGQMITSCRGYLRSLDEEMRLGR